jgi:hypothetical protein
VSDETQPDPIPDPRPLLRRPDWDKPYFHIEKAYLCCLFAQYAYQHVPEFELAGTDRLKLIPCQSFKLLLNQNKAHHVRQTLGLLDVGDIFVAETARAIAIGVFTDDLIIIAIRGTVVWYYPDWAINLRARKTPASFLKKGALHRGFYEATKDLCHKLSFELGQWARKRSDRPPIYITGHSLGGAMSACLYGLWPALLPGPTKDNFVPISAYTFGMPRYATSSAYEDLNAPHHIYRPRDLVPHLPTQKMGFADNPWEYSLHGENLTETKKRERTIRGIKHHFIEGYRSKLRIIADNYPSRRGGSA